MITLATYRIWHVKEGVISDDDNALFQTCESVVVPSKYITFDEMRKAFRTELDKKFGKDKWKFEYFLESADFADGFVVEGSEIGFEQKMLLKGFGKYIQFCHVQSNVEKLIEDPFFVEKHGDLIPIYKVAQQMMSQGHTGYLAIGEYYGTKILYNSHHLYSDQKIEN